MRNLIPPHFPVHIIPLRGDFGDEVNRLIKDFNVKLELMAEEIKRLTQTVKELSEKAQ